MTITKTITANGSKGHHRFSLRVNEDTTSGNSSFTSYSFTIAPIQTGWDWADWKDKISYEIKFTEKVVNEETNEITTNELYKATGTIPAYNGSSTVILSSGSDIEIEHESDGTKTIDISFKVTDNTGATYTCGNASASGSMILSALHTPPEITNVNISETNTTLTNLGVTNDTIVQYLSKKKFTITATTYDDAKISSYSIYHNNVLIGTSTTNEITIDFSNVNELMTSGTNYVGLTIAVIDDKDGYSTRIFNFPVIKYTRPTIESTSTTIKRKTSGGTVLTDNKVLLNFVGTCYKGNDVIGNNNKPTVQYKIWNTSEPTNYTTLTTSNAENVIIKDYEINNITYTSAYDYKIKMYDAFTNKETTSNPKIGRVPTGKSVWTEYKDRVDFIKATILGKNIIESGENENGSYIKYYDGTMICRGTHTIATGTWNTAGSLYYYDYKDAISFPQEFIDTDTLSVEISSNNSAFVFWCQGVSFDKSSITNVNLVRTSVANNSNITISYIAIGKWK